MKRRLIGFVEWLLGTGCRQITSYTRGLLGGAYLLCLHPKKVSELLTELHDRVCGSYVGGRSLAHRAMIQGFW